MITDKQNHKILVIAVWFGPIPAWFSLWLTSCRFNSSIDWLLVTDAQLTGVNIPANVHIARLSMSAFVDRIAASAGFPLRFEKAYKACDYRPLFGCLTDLAPGIWDFWGHCDIDMLFGNIRRFVTPELLESHDRIFGVGHFSLYRNNEGTNNFYRRPCPDLDYRKILSDPQSHGFDEHNGVNRIWRLHQGRFYENEKVVADIDPHVEAIRRTSSRSLVPNTRSQVFGFDKGRIIRAYIRGKQLLSEEFMYIHFQKRKFSLPMPSIDCERVWLTPAGFVPMNEEPLTRAIIQRLNPRPAIPKLSEIAHDVRFMARLMRREIMKSTR